jgi:peptidoglycan hydrolase-like protein with peptidoglycan-binding domain
MFAPSIDKEKAASASSCNIPARSSVAAAKSGTYRPAPLQRAAEYPGAPWDLSRQAHQSARLAVGPVDDAQEREADRIAEQVTGSSAAMEEQPKIGGLAGGTVHTHASADMSEERIGVGHGVPLEPSVRTAMESRFGNDFGAVRVHAGTEATRSAQSYGALAYTLGRHVVFRDGHYAPHTDAGRRLLAHELAHVVQQSRDGGSAARGMRIQRKEDSARFEGDKKIEDIAAGVAKLKKGDTGLQVTKLQQALVDLGLLPASEVNGHFGEPTEKALIKFQHDEAIAETGVLDKDSLVKLHAAYDTRKPYIDQAKLDPAHPGTRTLSVDDKAAALKALVPAPVPGAPSTFQDKFYGVRMEAHLTALIAAFHKELYEDKKPLRANEAKNFDSWAVLEAPASAAQDVVDQLYGSYYGGPGVKPPLTFAGGNLIDQWTDEIIEDVGLTAPQQKNKARGKVWYLINSNSKDINADCSAVPSNPQETAILTPIVEKLVATPKQVQTLLDLDVGWEGASLNGKVYLQRYKSTNPDANKAKEANRVRMWDLFQTCIHEYLHTLAHKDFNTWAGQFATAGDITRYNTLTEGFCDFFTLNVRKTVAPASVQAKVEGPYANGNPPAPDHSGVYPSHHQAEQVVSIVGIKNAQAAYFQGKTNLMGKI